jgi:hypothetical protein
MRDCDQKGRRHPRSLMRIGTVLLCLLVILVSMLFCVDAAFARAGGGGGFGGGGGGGFGGGGFGGGGSGGGDGDLFFLLFWLCIQRPLIGIPLLIAVAFVFFKGGMTANRFNQTRVIRKARQRQDALAYKEAVRQLMQRDPAFDEAAFLARIHAAFLQIQEAWCQMELRPVRAFVSDAVFERFSLQIKRMTDRGVRDHMEQIQVLDSEIVQVQSNVIFDTVTVRITAQAIDYQVHIKTNKKVRGSREPETFVEYWSLVRRVGTKTRQGKGLIEGNCPNCGDLLRMNEAAQCASCDSVILSGEYDWVLAEITQASEWQVKDSVSISGVSRMCASDPGFSLQHVEDRASVMFWRVMEATRYGKIDFIHKIASERFCQGFFDRHLKLNAQGQRPFPDDVAVGGVDTLGAIPGDPWDQLLVQIRWSAVNSLVGKQGRVQKAGAGASVRTHVYVLKRRHGIQSDVSKSLTSAHCPACGAPVTSSTSNACVFCKTVMNRGDQDWILDDIDLPYGQRIVALRAQFDQVDQADQTDQPVEHDITTPPPIPGAPVPSSGIEACAWLINVMIADGQINPKERALILRYTSARGMSRLKAESLLAGALQAGKIEAPEPNSTKQARAWLCAMVQMALVDGTVSKEEMHILLMFGKKLGWVRYDVQRLIAKTRRRMYEAAKTNLKRSKNKGSIPSD